MTKFNTLLRPIIILSIFLFTGHAFAQEKSDYIWLFGYQSNLNNPNIGGSRLDFNFMPPDTSRFNIQFDFGAIGMISDTSGALQFYTNGCQIMNSSHNLMANGDSINPGFYNDIYCPSGGYPNAQGVLILPSPSHPGMYYLIHQKHEDIGEKSNLLYSIIDMNTLDGLGKVIVKNQELQTDFFPNMLTAVRHANGRDWWIIQPVNSSNQHDLYLLTPYGIQGPFERFFGPQWTWEGNGGHSVFSPDGTWYARANPINQLNISQFDRCLGEFSNTVVVSIEEDSLHICGLAISSNSRYLYLTTGWKLYQFDLWSSNIPESKIFIDIYDGFLSPFKTTIYQPMLAPDNKIYISTTNGNNVLHVINNPDKAGLECNFIQHGQFLPTYHAFNIPNYPHFRLYDMEGSLCDTLGINSGENDLKEISKSNCVLSVQPNPANKYVLLHSTEILSGVWTVRNLTGLEASHGQWKGNNLKIETENLTEGLWFFILQTNKGELLIEKIVIIH